MNKLKILKINISSTAILSFAMFICLLCSMLLLPIGITQLIGYESTDDVELYSEELADYCLIDFPSWFYKDLKTQFDMENFAGIARVGNCCFEDGSIYTLEIVSDKMLNELPSRGYKFSKTKPKDYKEAYAPIDLRYDYEIGDFLEVSCDKGIYEYKQKIKIIGFADKEYYYFSYDNAKLSNIQDVFLIYDEIPPYSSVSGGIMLSDKSPEYYNNLGAKAKTLRELNERGKFSYSNDTVLYWSSCLLILLTIALAANYYFSVDKMTKRSGVMAIYGAKRSDIVGVELLKLIVIFATAFVLSAIFTVIMLVTTSGTTALISYLIAVGITLAVYAVSVSFGFIKYARFKPLKALANNNIE